jgi:hypothetical protein
MAMLKQVRGLAPKDGTKPIHLEITPKDIQKGRPLDPENCAAACALKRQGFTEAIVMRSVTYVNKGTKESPNWLRFATPNSLAREIVALDRGGRVEPGEFMVKPFNPARKLGAKTWHSRGQNGSSSTKPSSSRHVTVKIREA